MVEWAITGQSAGHIPTVPLSLPQLSWTLLERSQGQKKNPFFLFQRPSLVSEGGEEETRTTRVNISHVDKQIPSMSLFPVHPWPFNASRVQKDGREQMEIGGLGDWKKEVENSMAGDHGAVGLLLQGNLVFNPCPSPGDLLCFPSSLHDLEIHKRGLEMYENVLHKWWI